MFAITYFASGWDLSLVRAALLAILLAAFMAATMVVIVATITVLMPVIIAAAIFMGKLAMGLVIVAVFGWVTYPRPRRR